MTPRTASKRSTQDATGLRLIEAGKRLLATGTRLDELKIADAVDLASAVGPPLTVGAAYPRFRRQADFRQAVLRAVLREAPNHRSVALNVIARKLMELQREKGVEELRPEDVPRLLFEVAEEQQQTLRDDHELPLRLYALYRLSFEDEQAEELREDLHRRDAQLNMEWTETVRTLARELGVKPLNDLEYEEFEIALTSLLTGLAIRQRTSEVPPHLYARLVGALVLGFFQSERTDRGLTTMVSNFFTRAHARRIERASALLTSMVIAASESDEKRPRRVEPSSAKLGSGLSEPVRRALAADDAAITR